MNLFIQNQLDHKYKAAWRDYYTGQNLVAVRIACIISIILNIIIRFFYLAFPLSLTHAEKFPGFNISNWVFIGAGLFFYATGIFLIRDFRKHRQATAIMSVYVFVFAVYYIYCGVYCSFMPTGNPSNTLIMHLIGLIMIALLLVFEFYQTILLIIATELFFSFLLILSRMSPTEMVYNQLISAVLLAGFFLTSRYFSAYRASYYLRVQEIKEKTTAIENGSEFKSQVLGMVAHDLRNPIAAVETIAMMIEMDNVDQELEGSINLIKASCAQARTIIDELLESARNENTAKLITAKTELNNFLREIVEKWEPRAGTKKLILINDAGPIFVNLNHHKFHRVMDNLIGNALKFSFDNCSVEISARNLGTQVAIDVRDHGIGIPKDKLSAVFDPFTRAGRPGLRGEQSTGLGLSIVKQIVEKHAGKIIIESKEGEGTVFTIMLPVAE